MIERIGPITALRAEVGGTPPAPYPPSLHPDFHDVQGVFSIGTYGENIIESNALEHFGPRYGDPADRKEALEQGWIDKEGGITPKGWDTLNNDLPILERNALAWLRASFRNARDDGHDSFGDLVGAFWFDPEDPRQAELVSLGVAERIDMSDSSYGDLADTVWEGVSPFGSVLGGAINFSNIDPDVMERVEENADRARGQRRARVPHVSEAGAPTYHGVMNALRAQVGTQAGAPYVSPRDTFRDTFNAAGPYQIEVGAGGFRQGPELYFDGATIGVFSVGPSDDNTLAVEKIEIDPRLRGHGYARGAMLQLLKVADAKNATVTLTPAGDWGASVSRLRKFYRSLGFVENRGRRKDFAISDSMYRLPHGGPS